MIGHHDFQITEALLRSRENFTDRTVWWRGAMFYEVYVRSFNDSNGDGIGDLPGVIQKLDYLAGLGVDGIWLSPFYPSPQKDFGYDITDLRGVDPIHGTLDDMIELIREAHARELKILTDFVPCHTSNAHPWFLQSRQSRDNPKADWYVWADAAEDGGPPNNWLSSFGGSAWQWEPRRAQYYYHPFLDCQPALNMRCMEARCAVSDAMKFWRDLGVDGFRLDAIQCLSYDKALRSNPPRMADDDDVMLGGGPNNPFSRQTHHFDRDVADAMDVIETIRHELCDDHPDFVLIGELADVDSSRYAIKYTADDLKRLHAVYDFDMIHTGDSLGGWIETLQVRDRFIGSGWLMNVFTNHDSVRAVSNLLKFAVEADRRDDAAKLLLFMQSTLRGGGIVFQGEELGLPQPELKFEELSDPWGINLWPDFEGRDGVRTPIPWQADAPNGGFSDGTPWLTVSDAHLPLAVDRQEKDRGSVLNFFRALMKWRRKSELVRLGEEEVHDADLAPLIVYDRIQGDQRLTFVTNFSLEDHFVPVKGKAVIEKLPGTRLKAGENGVHVPGLGFGAFRLDQAEGPDGRQAATDKSRSKKSGAR